MYDRADRYSEIILKFLHIEKYPESSFKPLYPLYKSMPILESSIPGYSSRDERLLQAMAAFHRLQKKYEAKREVRLPNESPSRKPTVAGVAKTFNVARSTFTERLQGQSKPLKEAHSHRQRVTKQEEVALVTWIKQMQQWGWPPRVCQLRSMATEFLHKRGDRTPLGVNWIQKFLSRHPDLDSSWSRSIESSRMLFQSPENVRSWFSFWQSTLNRYNFALQDIYNMDEKGFVMGLLGILKVVCDKRLRAEEKALIKHCGKREWVFIIECISADGFPLQPHIIFAGKENQYIWRHTLKGRGSTSATESGWTNNEIGLKWLQECFEPQSKERQRGQYRLLLLDGHCSHVTNEAIEFCIAKDIVLLCLPAHSTHLLQPLDVGIFLPLTISYKSELEALCNCQFGWTIDKIRFIEIFLRARDRIMSSSNILGAWSKAGLFPHCPEAVLSRLPQQIERPHTSPEASVTYTGLNGNSMTMLVSPDKAAEVDDYIARYRHNSTDIKAVEGLVNVTRQALADRQIYKSSNEKLIEAEKLKAEHAGRKRGQHIKAVILNDRVYAAECSEARLEAEWQKLCHLEPHVFKHTVAKQRAIDSANKKLQKQKEQAAKTAAKKAAKEFSAMCMTFNKLAPDIFDDYSISSSTKSPTKSPLKAFNILNAPPLSSPSLLPPPQSPISSSPRVPSPHKAPLKNRASSKETSPSKRNKKEETIEETPIAPRVSRMGRIIRPTRR